MVVFTCHKMITGIFYFHLQFTPSHLRMYKFSLPQQRLGEKTKDA